MTPSEKARVQECVQELSEILYRNTPSDNRASRFAGLQPAPNFLGDGHSGVWNLFSQISTTQQRYEILDWFHLKENLFKVGGSLKRLRQAETFLWQGEVEQAISLFQQECPKRARKFIAYVEKHRHRLVNYELLQAEDYISIGSGAVESAIKQLDRRLKISGAQWNFNSVSPMLRLRCAYLNRQIAA